MASVRDGMAVSKSPASAAVLAAFKLFVERLDRIVFLGSFGLLLLHGLLLLGGHALTFGLVFCLLLQVDVRVFSSS